MASEENNCRIQRAFKNLLLISQSSCCCQANRKGRKSSFSPFPSFAPGLGAPGIWRIELWQGEGGGRGVEVAPGALPSGGIFSDVSAVDLGGPQRVLYHSSQEAFESH